MIKYEIIDGRIKFFDEKGRIKRKKRLNEEELKIRRDFHFKKVKEESKRKREEAKANKLTKEQWQERQIKRRFYMRSPEWLKLKQDVLDFQNQRCAHCRIIVDFGTSDLHHRHYENLFNEKIQDMAVLCRKCHHEFHEAEKFMMQWQ